MKKILIVAFCLAFVLLLSLGLVAACVVKTGQHLTFAVCLDEKASREETHAIDIEAGKVLSVELPAGRIRVTASTEPSPSLHATLTAFGDSQEDADQALSETKLELQGTSEGLHIRLVSQAKGESILGSTRNVLQADLDIRIPPGVRLDLESGSGDLECKGPFATSRLHASYGDVRIEAVEGDVDASSSSGSVSVVRGRGQKLVAKSNYGNVQVSDGDFTTVEAHSSSGDVKLERIRGERVDVGSGYGDVELLDLGGEVEARLSSGDVHLVRWTGSKAMLATNCGRVRVEHASGSLEARSSSGDVRIGDFEGALAAHSSYGSVDIDGVLTSIRADSNSGDVSARSRSGSRVEGPWKISSSYGNVKLELPDGFACQLDADTAYGDVDVGFPIEVPPGKRKEGSHSVRGKLNGGGGLVELRCTSGDVRVTSSGK